MNFVTHVTKAVDFTSQVDTGFAYTLSFIVLGAAILIGIICSFVCEDFFLLFLSLTFGAILFFGTFFVAINVQSNFSDKKIDEFQSWTSETYLIDLTNTQALDVLENQINMEEKSDSDANDAQNKVVVRNSYDDAIEITLVKDGKNWFILQSGSEAPAAMKEER